MKCSRGVPVVLAMAIAVVLGSAGWLIPRAHAQTVDRLRPEVTTAENLSNDQRRQIDQYVSGWAEQLMDGDLRRVNEARRQLLESLRAGTPSDAFVQYYSAQVAQRVPNALEHEQSATRVNAMIVVARLRSDDAMPLVEQAMMDDNAAVRYWAVKAIQSITFADDQKTQLIERLVEHIDQEPVVAVVEQAMLALVGLDLSDARMRGLSLLNQRLDEHLEEAGRSLQAEHSAMRSVYQHLAGTGSPNEQELRQLARTAVRYQDLAAQRLRDGDVDNTVRDSYERILQLCNAALRFTADSLNASGVPSSIDPLIGRGDWAGIQRNADQWRSLLQNAPFNLSEDDIALTS
ncbi:HEAT repeat domain-containing protein [Phycisphaerales bacterium AB-hyl4]|uniref:HEAT repeat domain-containing protein n=1 Tax=Natronomicrosphaera hydrolytica TaxID=3242702 RepID=A0ABV4U748_9BACT